jgi:hypothetical protein
MQPPFYNLSKALAQQAFSKHHERSWITHIFTKFTLFNLSKKSSGNTVAIQHILKLGHLQLQFLYFSGGFNDLFTHILISLSLR